MKLRAKIDIFLDSFLFYLSGSSKVIFLCMHMESNLLKSYIKLLILQN